MTNEINPPNAIHTEGRTQSRNYAAHVLRGLSIATGATLLIVLLFLSLVLQL
jgi:hypothetical protein